MVTASSDVEGARVINSPRRAATSAFAGGALEYYDNYIYATAAALVFGRVFFPEAGAGAVLASLATFAVSYVARPIGALVFGHFGDRVGRKRVLVIILIMMGVCSFLVGCLPGFAQIGLAAPILLVALRVLQGVSVGCETAAATTLTLESAPDGRRGFFTSWGTNGIIGGFVLATVVFLPISALPADQLLNWGWRIPFFLSVFVAIAGIIIRSRLAEPEIFVRAKEDRRLTRLPVAEAFRTHWRAILRVTICSLAFTIDTVVKVFALAFATTVSHIPAGTMLLVAIVGNVGALIVQPLLGGLSDRVGRKPVFITGTLGCAVMVFVYFAAIQSGVIPVVFIAGFVIAAGTYGAVNAVYPSFFSEMFSVDVRQTGMAIGVQLGLIASGFAPAVLTALTADDATNWVPIAIISAIISVLAGGAALTAKETSRMPLVGLGVSTEDDRVERSAHAV